MCQAEESWNLVHEKTENLQSYTLDNPIPHQREKGLRFGLVRGSTSSSDTNSSSSRERYLNSSGMRWLETNSFRRPAEQKKPIYGVNLKHYDFDFNLPVELVRRIQSITGSVQLFDGNSTNGLGFTLYIQALCQQVFQKHSACAAAERSAKTIYSVQQVAHNKLCDSRILVFQYYLVDAGDDGVEHLVAERPEHQAAVLHQKGRKAAAVVFEEALAGGQDINKQHDIAIVHVTAALHLRSRLFSRHVRMDSLFLRLKCGSARVVRIGLSVYVCI